MAYMGLPLHLLQRGSLPLEGVLRTVCTMEFNPLRAKFFRWNINIYLHLMSLLHIDMTQVLKILPQVRPGPMYSR